MGRKLTTEEFINKSNNIHDFKYDYSLTNYINSLTKVKIICKEHGVFEQTAIGHTQGCGCTLCGKIQTSYKRMLTKEDFIYRANKIHNNKYDYSKFDNKGKFEKVCIICPDHGEFFQLTNEHLQSKGCPSCRESKGEKKIREYLDVNKIEYFTQEWFKNSENQCKNPETNTRLPFDFYLPRYNLCIEYDGRQHYELVSYCGNQSIETKIKNLSDTRYRDGIKDQYCIGNGIKLLRIPYWKIKKIDNILSMEIFK